MTDGQMDTQTDERIDRETDRQKVYTETGGQTCRETDE